MSEERYNDNLKWLKDFDSYINSGLMKAVETPNMNRFNGCILRIVLMQAEKIDKLEAKLEEIDS